MGGKVPLKDPPPPLHIVLGAKGLHCVLLFKKNTLFMAYFPIIYRKHCSNLNTLKGKHDKKKIVSYKNTNSYLYFKIF